MKRQMQKIAEYIGTKHNELYIDDKQVLQLVKKISEYYTEPFADSSECATLVLNKFACKNNIKTAITGDGADQLFCRASLYDKMSTAANKNNIEIISPFLNSKFIEFSFAIPHKFKYYKKIYIKRNFI